MAKCGLQSVHRCGRNFAQSVGWFQWMKDPTAWFFSLLSESTNFTTKYPYARQISSYRRRVGAGIKAKCFSSPTPQSSYYEYPVSTFPSPDIREKKHEHNHRARTAANPINTSIHQCGQKAKGSAKEETAEKWEENESDNLDIQVVGSRFDHGKCHGQHIDAVNRRHPAKTEDAAVNEWSPPNGNEGRQGENCQMSIALYDKLPVARQDDLAPQQTKSCCTGDKSASSPLTSACDWTCAPAKLASWSAAVASFIVLLVRFLSVRIKGTSLHAINY